MTEPLYRFWWNDKALWPVCSKSVYCALWESIKSAFKASAYRSLIPHRGHYLGQCAAVKAKNFTILNQPHLPGTVVILCSDGMKHLFWLCLGKVAQNILSVRNCSPNWQQFPQQRTFFLVNFQQDTQFRKSWGHPFLNLKSTLVLVNDCKKL